MPAILAMLTGEYSVDRLQSQAWPARTVASSYGDGGNAVLLLL